jgi:photosystem II stability/assembly factor-like uncharacterized protein
VGPARFVASTEAGISVAALDEGAWSVRTGIERWALALGACAGRLFAGTRDGLLVSEDGGLSWRLGGFEGRRVSAVGCGPSVVYAGTKGPELFRSDDGGDTWTELRSFRALRRWYWWTPVSKPNRLAEVSSLAVSPRDEGLVVAGIELGAVVRTTDAGRTWEGHKPQALRDCHSLAFHRIVPGYVYEGGAGGGAFSRDEGRTWTRARRGLGRAWYGWAAAGDRGDPETRYLSATRGVRAAHGNKPRAWIFRTRGEQPWRALVELAAMPYALIPLEDRLFAGLSDGRVLASESQGESWVELPFRFASIWRAFLAL